MDQSMLETLDMYKLGDELQKARKRKGLTQEDAAKIINAARTTITAIEKGERRIKASELDALAHAYGCQVSDFVRDRPQLEPFVVQFRASVGRTEEDEEIITPYIDQLEHYCRYYLELEQLTQSPLRRKYPPISSLHGLKAEQAAEIVALEERNRLGLGDGPLPVLRDILEQDVGLRIFYLEMPTNFSAMYLYTEQLGGCIAINKAHPEERRRWSLAHDYGHFLAHRYRPTVSYDDKYRRVPESERFADAFAAYFLMPTSSVTRQYGEIQRKGNPTLADLGNLAHYYGVSFQALVLRLEEMKFLPSGTWRKLQDRGLKTRELQRRLGHGDFPAREEQFPLRYTLLAFEALRQGLIIEGYFARLLQVSRLEAAKIEAELRELTQHVEEQPPSDQFTQS
ncbi:hypothetical protein KSF_089220 [Reticulibacter mediterranei]|uniref:HTH cro/C1-type domain-containing protein n=1 Tax=Reticulibacter mediterranei TaxID=2778369 RepID=A0A8J3N5A2_9CHLR|nr:XRE family transcriptional regulator [Reticulibacter mediterranei]GHO98874.1 hypothetical protein KSF_089220 [Reticulibacter mediterranei]